MDDLTRQVDDIYGDKPTDEMTVAEIKELLDGITNRWIHDELTYHRGALLSLCTELDRMKETREAAHMLRFALVQLDDVKDAIPGGGS